MLSDVLIILLIDVVIYPCGHLPLLFVVVILFVSVLV
jgi:hypothetical protein